MDEDLKRYFDQQFSSMREHFEGRFESMDRRFDGKIEQLRQEMNQRFDGVDQRLDGVDQRLDGVDQRLDRVDQRLDRVESDVQGLKADVQHLKSDVQQSCVLIEDIHGQVRLVADGVANCNEQLQRHREEVAGKLNGMEELDLRVRRLESAAGLPLPPTGSLRRSRSR